jgi:translation initiation factor 2 subunit 3
VGDEIEIKPGIQITRAGKTTWQPLTSKITSLHAAGESIEEAVPGGLIGVGTELDPSLTKADRLIGSVVGARGTLPPVLGDLDLEVHLLERAVGTAEELEVKPLVTGEPLMISVGTATTVGTITSAAVPKASIALKIPVCTEKGARVAISRRIAGRWRLIGYGIIR